MNSFKQHISILIAIIFASILVQDVFSQDNHNYITKLGYSVYYRELDDANRKTITMSDAHPLSAGMDGLTIAFYVRTNFSLVKEPLKLISFTNSTEENSYIDIYYHNSTMIIRRKETPGSSSYYDYVFYDPLFVPDNDDVTWGVHIFFSAHAFWFETEDTRKAANNRWHEPIFFGINSPNQNFMSDFIERKSTGKIIFGTDDYPPSTIFYMPYEIGLYEFNYSQLRTMLNDEFSKGN